MLTNSPIVAKLLYGKAKREDWVNSKIRPSERDNLENRKLRGPKNSTFLTSCSSPVSSHTHTPFLFLYLFSSLISRFQVLHTYWNERYLYVVILGF